MECYVATRTCSTFFSLFNQPSNLFSFFAPGVPSMTAFAARSHLLAQSVVSTICVLRRGVNPRTISTISGFRVNAKASCVHLRALSDSTSLASSCRLARREENFELAEWETPVNAKKKVWRSQEMTFVALFPLLSFDDVLYRLLVYDTLWRCFDIEKLVWK